MRNFSSKTKANYRRSYNRPLVRVVAAGAVIAFVVIMGRDFIGGVFARVTTPIHTAQRSLVGGISDIPSYFTSKASLIAQADALKEGLLREQGENAAYDALLAEHEALRAQYGVATTADRIAAGVIVRPPYVPYDALLIDQGSTDGIEEGALVYHYGEQVIGYVSRSFKKSALVTLITTPGVQSTVYIIGPDIYTTAYGDGDGVLRVSVPQGIALETGNMVVLPSLERGVIGEIDTVRAESTEPEQNGYVVMDTPIQSLRYVTVGTSVPEQISFEEARQHVEAFKASFLSVPVPEGVLVDEATTTDATSSATSTEAGVEEQ